MTAIATTQQHVRGGVRNSHLALLTCLFLACSNDELDATIDASPPDAGSLTIADICVMLTPVTCERDAECFQSLDPPCAESFYFRCCERFDSCDRVNGVSSQRVDECIAAMESATCDEIENDFPESCAHIAECTDCAAKTDEERAVRPTVVWSRLDGS